MANCRGYIYGVVTSSTTGKPISNVDVTLNWVQVEGGGNELRVGGDDDLKTYVPRVSTTQAGEYILPFYWASQNVPGSLASALGMLYFNDGSHSASNQHGTVAVEPDVAKQLKTFTNTVSPSMPDSASGAASLFLKYYIKATPELKGMTILTAFISDFKNLTVLQQAIFCRIDFSFETAPEVTAVGTRTG